MNNFFEVSEYIFVAKKKNKKIENKFLNAAVQSKNLPFRNVEIFLWASNLKPAERYTVLKCFYRTF